MLGQRNTLNESTTKSFEGLFVITFSFCFVSLMFLLVICYCVVDWVCLVFRKREGTGGSVC